MPGNPEKQKGKSPKALLEQDSLLVGSLSPSAQAPARFRAGLRQFPLKHPKTLGPCPSQDPLPIFLSGCGGTRILSLGMGTLGRCRRQAENARWSLGKGPLLQ